MPHYELIKYISSADLVADSFPMVGGTAMIDAINYGAPVVTLKDFVGQMDYIINSPAYCKDIDELINKSKTLLYDKEAAAENINKLKELTKNYNNPNIFREKLINLYNSLPQNHNIYSFSNDDNYEFIDGDIFAYYSTTSHKSFKLLGFKFISISFKNYLGKKIHHFFIQKHDKISQIF